MFGIYWLNNPDAYIENNGVRVVYDCWSSLQTGEINNKAEIVGDSFVTNYSIVTAGESPLGEVNGNIYNSNVSHHMRVWFEWGFIIQLTGVFGSIIGILGTPEKTTSSSDNKTDTSRTIMKAGIIFMGIAQLVSGFAWIIIGSVIRFRFTGCVCSGDGNWNTDLPYMTPPLAEDSIVMGMPIKTGQFMKVWIILNYCFFGAFSIWMAAASIIFKKNQSN